MGNYEGGQTAKGQGKSQELDEGGQGQQKAASSNFISFLCSWLVEAGLSLSFLLLSCSRFQSFSLILNRLRSIKAGNLSLSIFGCTGENAAGPQQQKEQVKEAKK